MFCPVCKDSPLMMSERQGVEIDYCPKCRGIWLDRGELDKIIQISMQQAMPAPEPTVPHYTGGYPGGHHGNAHGGHGGKHDKHGGGYGYRRQKSFFERLFD